MSFLKKLAGQAATYGISSILGRIANFLLVPFYTNPNLTGIKLAEFGIYTDLYAYMGFLNIVYLFGMETAFFRFSNREEVDKTQTYNTAESALIVWSLFLSGLLVLFSGPITQALRYPGKQWYIISLALILAVDAIVAIPFARLRLENKAATFARFKLTNIFLNIFFNFFFLFFCRQIVQGNFLPFLEPIISRIYMPGFEVGYIILSNLIANALLFLFLRKSFAALHFHLDIRLLKEMFRYAWPLMFMGLAGMVNELLDRILLRNLLPSGFYPGKTSLEALGIYGACYKLSMFMSLAVQAFRYAAEPFFFSHAKEKNAPEMFAAVMKYFIITCCVIYVAVSCNLPFVGLILGSSVYREGLDIVPVLLLANLFLGIYVNLSAWYKITDKTYAGTTLTFIGAGITIGANILLIPVLGYMGSAIATLLCYAGMAIIAYVWGQKHFPIPYNISSALFYLLIASVLAWLSYKFLNQAPTGIRLLTGTGITASFTIFALLLEKNNLKKEINI